MASRARRHDPIPVPPPRPHAVAVLPLAHVMAGLVPASPIR
ncbi:hypothetical protein [Microvirga yunnanensis]|nr:hypothetical protein [Microvirga sp. HBU65207]